MIRAIVLCLLLGFAGPATSVDLDFADRVVVKKSERKLLLLKKGAVLKEMDVSLGLLPTGHKRREGDYRTPEGNYRLVERNANSDFFLSIRISYPSTVDQQRASARGEPPGGQIMIHGLPNEPRRGDSYYQSTDWTDGCIAVSNSDMVDIWLMTRVNTPIQILP